MPALKEKQKAACQLRREGMSVREIAKKLDVAYSSVSVWVRDIELTPEQRDLIKDKQRSKGGQIVAAQANKQKALEKRKQFQELGRIKARENSILHRVGCMLYWAEGSKDRTRGLYFVNSDEEMMALFIQFLRAELHVQNHEMVIHIHCHSSDTSEIQRVEQFWLDHLQLPRTALKKTIYKKGSDTRYNILKNGVCSLRVYRSEIIHHIFGAIQEYGGFDRPEWLD